MSLIISAQPDFDVTIQSVDSSPGDSFYDAVYLQESEYKITSVYEIEVLGDGISRKICIGATDGAISIHARSFIIDEHLLVLCCGSAIFSLSLPQLELKWLTQCDTITCFEIFRHEDKYIVHGEMEISCLDAKGKLLWQQSGADIFTTPEKANDFELTKDYIFALDWNYNVYKID